MLSRKKVYRNRWFYAIELLIDIFIVIASYYFGFVMQRPNLFTAEIPVNVIIALIYIGVIAAIVFVIFKVYKCGQKSLSTTLFYIAVSLPLIAISSIAVDFAIKGIGIWRMTIFYALLAQVPAFIIFKLIVSKIHKRIIKLKPCVIIGKDLKDTYKLYSKLQEDNYGSFDLKYLATDKCNNLLELVNQSMHVVLSSSCNKKIKTKIIEHCAINDIDCSIVPSYKDIIINSGKFNNIGDTMLLDMTIKMDMESRFIKRTMDIVLSFTALVILSPLMLITSLLIKLQDGGNPFFTQNRVTRYNKEFKLYKFRTMIENAEKNTGAVLAQKNDTRITKLGKFLRAFRVDEIPQLINVFKGDMSLIGPRPERKEIIEQIIKETPEFEYRTLVRAGVTGLAQTMGRYDTEFKDKLLFDMYYVNNFSIALDLKIIFYTFHTLTKPSVTVGVDNDSDISSVIKNTFENKGFAFLEHDDYVIIEKTKR